MTGILATSYSLNHGPAFAGMVADGQLNNIISKLNVDTAIIAYGKGVVRDGEGGAKLPLAGSLAGDFLGVAVRELNRSYKDGDTFGAVQDKDFSVLTVGTVWVKALETVVAGDKVFVRVGATGTGDFCKTAGASATLSVEIPNAKFLTGAAANGLAKVSFVVGG
jgi:hypothetical protein